MNNKLYTIKSLVWIIAVIICSIALIGGIIFTMFQRYYGEKPEFTMVLQAGDSESDSVQQDAVTALGNQRGELKILEKNEDAGEEYLNHVCFLIDSTFINLRQTNYSDRVWASAAGNMPVTTVNESGRIKFPNDGSMISAAEAAMILKPEVLVIGIGSDGLADISQDEFVSSYDTLITEILTASPDTQIICCGLPGVVETYSNVDRLDVTVMSDGNDWVQLVCRDTGASFLNVREALTESGVLLTRFADSNGKTLNQKGLDEFLMYLRTHCVQLKNY